MSCKTQASKSCTILGIYWREILSGPRSTGNQLYRYALFVCCHFKLLFSRALHRLELCDNLSLMHSTGISTVMWDKCLALPFALAEDDFAFSCSQWMSPPIEGGQLCCSGFILFVSSTAVNMVYMWFWGSILGMQAQKREVKRWWHRFCSAVLWTSVVNSDHSEQSNSKGKKKKKKEKKEKKKRLSRLPESRGIYLVLSVT